MSNPSSTPLKGVKVQKRKVVSTANPTSSLPHHQLMSQATKMKRTKINEMKKQRQDFLRRVNYGTMLTAVVLPLLAIAYLIEYKESIVPENQMTLYFTCIYYNITMLAFTSGYHKYFAHNSFKIRALFLKYFFAIFGSSCGLGSIRWWATLHRAHHNFTDDTEKDPYLIKRGLLYAHYGWLLKRPKLMRFYNEIFEQEFSGQIENQGLENEAVVENEDEIDLKELLDQNSSRSYSEEFKCFFGWQQRTYMIWFFLTTILIPALVTKFVCHDTVIHGVLYPGLLRMLLCQQSLLSTESICHLKRIQVTIPTQPFNDTNSSINCNNPLVSILTYGQAHQNYHHEFPHDYRVDNSLFSYDPTKWFLWTLEKVGFIEDLSRTPDSLVMQLKLQQLQKVINRLKSQLNWGTPISKLPLITPKDFKKIIVTSSNKDRIYIIIQKIIYDVTPFMDQHPGGVALLKASNGQDATKAFYGGVYGHLTAAVNLLATMRIGVLDDGKNEEVWKKVARQEREVVASADSRSGQSHTAEAA
ncbi:Acyl-CoA desaturase [Candida viswanathii]|uniref:Acyl-CoA desaturase n=1 Tax=Candida viswanathii TaxID=5486 RepID=A0A367XP10_9ASCO|nr:Acyl-CoA desaturase [Candida viswanathii]